MPWRWTASRHPSIDRSRCRCVDRRELTFRAPSGDVATRIVARCPFRSNSSCFGPRYAPYGPRSESSTASWSVARLRQAATRRTSGGRKKVCSDFHDMFGGSTALPPDEAFGANEHRDAADQELADRLAENEARRIVDAAAGAAAATLVPQPSGRCGAIALRSPSRSFSPTRQAQERSPASPTQAPWEWAWTLRGREGSSIDIQQLRLTTASRWKARP
mmetsp:Transcript_97800/g.276650  ORF Transcript_97800/g.276650 Transcript_97800/m.276650 type:complete len:218 (-) Transcript_97800:169-822(-)